MPKYKVVVTIESYYYLDVEAMDEFTALDKATDQCERNGYIADSSEVRAEIVDSFD